MEKNGFVVVGGNEVGGWNEGTLKRNCCCGSEKVELELGLPC